MNGKEFIDIIYAKPETVSWSIKICSYHQYVASYDLFLIKTITISKFQKPLTTCSSNQRIKESKNSDEQMNLNEMLCSKRMTFLLQLSFDIMQFQEINKGIQLNFLLLRCLDIARNKYKREKNFHRENSSWNSFKSIRLLYWLFSWVKKVIFYFHDFFSLI